MALNFTASQSQYLMTNQSPLQATPLTISAWMRRASVGATHIAVSIDSTTAASTSIVLYVDSSNIVTFNRVVAGTGVLVTAPGTVAAGEWVHVCGLVSASAQAVAYRNGVAGSAIGSAGATWSSDRLHIGVNSFNNSLTGYMNGDIAEVAVWNTGLSLEMIRDGLFKGYRASLIRPTNLVFYAPLIRDINEIRNSAPLSSLGGGGGATPSRHPRLY